MKQKRKFGLLLIVTVIIAATVLLLAKTDLIKKTKYYIPDDENRIENIVDFIKEGNHFVVIDRSGSMELNHIVDIIYDHPDIFWLDMEYKVISLGNVSALHFKDKYDNIEEKQFMIEKTANTVLQGILTEDMNEYDKVLAIHDWICENVIYIEGANASDQELYGALVAGEARCAGYAKAFTYLLDKAGIKSSVVSGESIDKYGNSVPHAWNVVYIYNEPYYFDITWDDDYRRGATHDWFGLTTEEFKKSHFPSLGYEWENAVATDACYYVKNGMCISNYSVDQLAAAVLRQGNSFTLKCSTRNVLDDVIEALSDKNEMQQLMRLANINKIDTISYETNDNNYCIFVKIS